MDETIGIVILTIGCLIIGGSGFLMVIFNSNEIFTYGLTIGSILTVIGACFYIVVDVLNHRRPKQ
jgi:hypothetical protein